MVLTQDVYQATKNFPKDEIFGLTSQLRRAVVSVALNIAEGKGRYSQKEFAQFLYLARGSLYETITCVKLANQLHYLDEKEMDKILKQSYVIQSQLSGLIKSLKNKKP